MFETSASLLDRLRVQSDKESWRRFVDLYTPLIRSWLRRQGAQLQDTDDLAQDVLAVVVRKVPQFRREPRTGAFRCWLRNITVHCLQDFVRSRRIRPAATGDSNFLEMLQQLEDPKSALARHWDEEYDRHVSNRLLELVKPLFKPTTWEAFERVVLKGGDPEAVAAELGISVNAVCIAKSRVLARLRQEAQDLID